MSAKSKKRIRLYDDAGKTTQAYKDVLPMIQRFAAKIAKEMAAKNIHHHDLERAMAQF